MNFKERFWLDFYAEVKWKSYFELNFNQISILIMESLPVVISSGISEARSGISRFILWASQSVESEMSVLSEDIKQRKELLISKDLIQAFIDSRTLWLNSLVREEEDSNMQEAIISELAGNDKDTMIEKAQMEKIMQFKNTVLSKIKNSPKFNLGMSGFETAFNNWIDYKKVLELYMLLNWESDLDNIDATISLWVYYWISSVLPEQSLQWQYLWSLLKEVTEALNNESDILNEEQALLFEGMLWKVSNSFLRVYLENSSRVMWWISEISKSELEEVFGFEIPNMVNELDLVEWSLVAWLIGSWYVVTKLPIPLQAKLILSGTLTTFWISGALSILHERWTLKKIFDTEWDNELKKSLDKTLKDEMDISLEEAAQMDGEEFSEVIAKAFH